MKTSRLDLGKGNEQVLGDRADTLSKVDLMEGSVGLSSAKGLLRPNTTSHSAGYMARSHHINKVTLLPYEVGLVDLVSICPCDQFNGISA